MIQIKNCEALAKVQKLAQECIAAGADHVLVELEQDVCAETAIDGPDQPLCLYVIPPHDGDEGPRAWLGPRSQLMAR